MNSAPKKVIIAGAGCAGLAAGVALQKRGFQVMILEKMDRVGGLAGGIVINGNTYEYGPHIFHTTDPEIMEDVQRIAGHVLIPFEKTIKVKFMGKYFGFPLEIKDVLFKLPPLTVIQAGFSLVKHFFVGIFEGEAALVNSEKVLQRYYGDVLYRIFFRDYISKVWGIPPTGMAPSFAKQRVPRLDLIGIWEKIKNTFFPKKSESIKIEGYVEKVEGVNYTTTKGFSAITEAYADEFRKLGGEIRLNTEIVRIQVSDTRCDQVVFRTKGSETEQTAACDEVISTIPISILPRLLFPTVPAAVLSAAKDLKFRGIVFVGLLIRKPSVLPATFMYFRDKIFNRIMDLAQFHFDLQPKGSTILIAEITCQPEDDAWINEKQSIETVINELLSENLFTHDDVIEAHSYKLEHAYPIYSVGYEEALKNTLAGMSDIKNLHTIGRQGKFAYVNTHVAMKMGYEVAKKVGSLTS